MTSIRIGKSIQQKKRDKELMEKLLEEKDPKMVIAVYDRRNKKEHEEKLIEAEKKNGRLHKVNQRLEKDKRQIETEKKNMEKACNELLNEKNDKLFEA